MYIGHERNLHHHKTRLGSEKSSSNTKIESGWQEGREKKKAPCSTEKGRHEEIVPRSDAADLELDAIVEKLLPVCDIDEAVRILSPVRLHAEHVANVTSRKAGAEALRHGNLERATLRPPQLLEIEAQVKADVVSRGEALPLATGWITKGVGDKRKSRSDAVFLEPAAHAVPVAEQVLARQDQLERRS